MQSPEEWSERYGVALPAWEELVKGAILGLVEVVDCVRAEELSAVTPWAFGPWCWVLGEPKVFEEPVPWKGQQSLYTVPEELAAR